MDSIVRTCPGCGSCTFSILFSGGELPSVGQVDATQFNLVECIVCGSCFVNPAPNPDSIGSFYPPDYYSPIKNQWSLALHRLAEIKSPLAGRSRSWITAAHSDGLARRSSLDVGCANGDNSQPYIVAGWQVDGVEPKRELADAAKARGVDVIAKHLEEVGDNTHRYDVVILNHVLEHLYSPQSCLDKCRALIKPGGHLYVEVPLLRGPSSRVFGRDYGDLEFPVHLSLLTKSVLVSALEKSGFRVTEVHRRTLLGTVARSISHRFPASDRTGPLGRLLTLLIVLECQFLLTVLVSASRTPDAVAIVATPA